MSLLHSPTADELLLLCPEDAAAFADEDLPLEYDGGGDDDIEVALVAAESSDLSPGSGHSPCLGVDVDCRRRSVDWLLKVCSYHHFQPLTAYLAVNYLDRFLSCHSIPQQHSDGWPMQLLSVACLSVAAKLEETQVPALLDLQVEDARFVFEPQAVCRMEVLVLTSLNWRLRCPTPFSFLNFFARKAEPQSRTIKLLTTNASMVILELVRDVKFLEYHPSTIAAAALLYASNETTNASSIGPEVASSWFPFLVKDNIMNCYQFMRKSTRQDESQRMKLRSQQTLGESGTIEACHEAISSPSSHPNKRRKPNNSLLVEGDKDEPSSCSKNEELG